MNYKIIYASTAEKELNKLSESDFKKIQRAINSLSENPFPPGHIKLEGTKEKLYRIRKGDYRVIYTVEKDIITITILKIGHRKDVYRS
jgi:mRNA interferase RelE/StbE